jgi:hypothetical protein
VLLEFCDGCANTLGDVSEGLVCVFRDPFKECDRLFVQKILFGEVFAHFLGGFANVTQQFQIQNFRSLKPLIYRSNQAPLRGLDRLKRRKSILNLELLNVTEAFEMQKILPAKGLRFLEFLKFSADDAEDCRFRGLIGIFLLKVADELLVIIQEYVDVSREYVWSHSIMFLERLQRKAFDCCILFLCADA